jgi:serine/threonine-protein kinase
MQAAKSLGLIRFGIFEVDLRSGELRRDGLRVKLPEQSFQILAMLLTRPGEVVTREEIRLKLWPNDTIVEFDQSINAATRRLRLALGDSAENPEYVETLARRGYRFKVLVQTIVEAPRLVPAPAEQEAQRRDVAPAPEPDSDDLTGKTISHYEILQKLGRGGMGVVYMAEDRVLGRKVALKFLPEELAGQPRALERFQGEARSASALNHPNICTIYEVGEDDGQPFIAMELLDGETLNRRMGGKPLKTVDALEIAIQIADALEAAHSAGIIHRDIKPANIMLTARGQAKVLDFGLAKFVREPSGIAAASESPQSGTTGDASGDIKSSAGVAMGTAAYMSPEQARGEPVDKRTDIWAFGCVLYELLTARKAFPGETTADSLAAILEREPDWNLLPPTLPAQLRHLLRRCLQKEVHRRLRDIGDARIEIEEAIAGPATAELDADAGMRSPSRWRSLMAWSGPALLIGAAIIALAVWALRPTPLPQPISRFGVTLPSDAPIDIDNPWIAISPDGRELVYRAMKGGYQQLYLRALDEMEARPIPGTEDGFSPFFSPDGQWIGYFSYGRLKKVSLLGGPPVTLCRSLGGGGGSWGENGTIVFAPEKPGGGLEVVSAAGGTPNVLTSLDSNRGEVAHGRPQVLPGGTEILFSVLLSAPGSTNTDHEIVVQSLRTGDRRVLVRGAGFPRYVPTGHLVYRIQNGTLMAARFDLKRLELVGSPVAVVENVAPIGGSFDFSRGGSLVYIPQPTGSKGHTLAWVDRKGAAQSLPVPPHEYEQPRLSPDGRRLAITADDTGAIWVYDVARQTFTRFTFGGRNFDPMWSPDGNRLAFESDRAGAGSWNVFWKAADGTGLEELLISNAVCEERPGKRCAGPEEWSPDGRTLAALDVTTGRAAISVIPLDAQRQPWFFSQTPSVQIEPTFSPDGHWLAYAADESGQYQIYVQPFPGPGGKWQISTDGGREPFWSRNGKELFYRNGRKMMVLDVTLKPSFTAAQPKVLFEGRYVTDVASAERSYDVTPDGQRFVMIMPSEQELAATQINVVLNWFEDLKRRVGPGGKQ